jgi:hypothetical protein
LKVFFNTITATGNCIRLIVQYGTLYVGDIYTLYTYCFVPFIVLRSALVINAYLKPC